MAVDMCIQNCTESSGFLYEMITREMWTPWESAVEYFEYKPWLFSLLGSTMIGLTGIFPLLVIPINEGADLKTGDSAGTLRILLSFAVGGLLGDVFLHLLPEAWETDLLRRGSDAGHSTMTSNIWVLSGFLVFVIVEKLFSFEVEPDDEGDESVIAEKQETREKLGAEKEMENNNCITLTENNLKNGLSKRCVKTIDELQSILEKKNGYSHLLPNGYKDPHGFARNGVKPMLMCDEFANTLGGLIEAQDCLKKEQNSFSADLSKGYSKDKQIVGDASGDKKTVKKEKSKHITGYLNLIANVIDNFTHGLAVGGSFLVSLRLGVLTTFAILIHEIPHEVGDFAILLRSGFNRWDAARAQLLTATGGIFGAMSAIFFSGGVGAKTSWILPFTAGGFLHIGMVTILPELMKESDPKESLKQVAALIFGVVLMAALTILCD